MPQTPIDIAMDNLGANTATTRPKPNPNRNTAQQAPRRRPTPSQQPKAPRGTSRSTLNPILEFMRSQSMRLGLGVFLIVLAIVMTIVTLNYLKNGAADQSLVAGNSVETIANAPEGVENAGGAIGAKIAHLLMVDGLGIGSFVIVFYIGWLALSLFGLLKCRFWAFTFKSLFTAISLSIIFGLLTYNTDSIFHWGGNHGRYVNQWLYHVSDVLGAYAVTVVLVGLLAVMYLTQLKTFISNVSGHVARTRAAMEAAAAQGRHPSTELADVPDKEPVSPAKATAASPIEAPAEKPKPAQGFVGFSIDDDIPAKPAAPAPAKQPENHENPGEPEFKIKTATLGDGPAATTTPDMPGTEVQPFSIRDELSHYVFPTADLLIDRPAKVAVDEVEQEENKNMIVKTLKDYGIPISKIEATIGPTVTLYEIVPAEGVRIAQIKRLEDDIALSLAALGIRIIAPIPGKGTVGIEVPNREPQTVSMYSVINSRAFRECKFALPMALGATINNDIFIADLTRMPHLLVAGATGQGKSVGLNCIIASLLYKKHPGELKFVLIDPKMVEFSLYSRIERHYLAKLPDEEEPIVTEPSKALATLSSICIEMDNRYDLLKAASVRTVEEYNAKFARRVLNPEKGHKYLPYIVVVVDEFADLIMTAGKDISLHIARIAQKARAVGIHMIIATQRPSTDIITGMIKANFPGRIAFRVASMVDSKTILDRPGANRLIGRGDLLFSHNSRMERVQCAFIDTPEVEAIVDHIEAQIGYPTAYLLPEPQNDNALTPGAVDLSKRDELFDDCARFVTQNSTASTSSLQRRFGIGYNKAGKIMDQLEAAGIVGPADGQKPRAVLVDSMAIEDMLRSL